MIRISNFFMLISHIIPNYNYFPQRHKEHKGHNGHKKLCVLCVFVGNLIINRLPQ